MKEDNMSQGEKKITVRVDLPTYEEITRKAQASNMSLNQYMIACCRNARSGDEKQYATLMGQLCNLQNMVQRAKDLPQLKEDIYCWRRETIDKMEKAVELWQR